LYNLSAPVTLGNGNNVAEQNFSYLILVGNYLKKKVNETIEMMIDKLGQVQKRHDIFFFFFLHL